MRAGLRRPHLDVEGRAAGCGGCSVGSRNRLRLQGADGRDWDGCWLARPFGSGLLGGGEGRLVGNDHPLVAGDRRGHRRGGGSGAGSPGALRVNKEPQRQKDCSFSFGSKEEGLRGNRVLQ